MFSIDAVVCKISVKSLNILISLILFVFFALGIYHFESNFSNQFEILAAKGVTNSNVSSEAIVTELYHAQSVIDFTLKDILEQRISSLKTEIEFSLMKYMQMLQFTVDYISFKNIDLGNANDGLGGLVEVQELMFGFQKVSSVGADVCDFVNSRRLISFGNGSVACIKSTVYVVSNICATMTSIGSESRIHLAI